MRIDKRGMRPGGDAAVKTLTPEEVVVVRTPSKTEATLVTLDAKNNIKEYMYLTTFEHITRLMRSYRKDSQ